MNNKITRNYNMSAKFYLKQAFKGTFINFESFYNGLRKRHKIRQYLRNKGEIIDI